MGRGCKSYPKCRGRDCVKRIGVYLKCGKLLWGLFAVYKITSVGDFDLTV